MLRSRCILPKYYTICHQLHRFSSSKATPSNTQHCPLHGIRVLDISRILAGPYCTMILGDLGAEVIKIERPDGGDDTRTWGPPWVGKESAYFFSINRNKKSVAVNMKTKEGQKIVRELACASDVLVENYLPGKLSKLGLGYEELAKVAPHLIYCSITGYGQSGPYSQRGGYDVIAAGMGGLMHITGPQDGDPCRVGVAMTDLSTGLYAYGAIMAALLYRQRSGRGQHIDCNLLSTQVATLTHIGSNYLNAGQEAKRYGSGHGSIVPYQAFTTADGHLLVGAGNEKLFASLCECMDLERLIDDPDYNSNAQRVKNRDKLLKIFSDRFRTKTTQEWLTLFENGSFPYGPINNMQQVFSDPQVKHNGLIQEMEHPTLGTISVPGPAVRYSDSQVVLQGPPPTLGQHTQQVLQDVLNLSQQQLQQLSSNGIIV